MDIVYIKNMVCPRCITAVEGLLTDMKIPFSQVSLGRVEMTRGLTDTQRTEMADRLKTLGFELLEPGRSVLIARIKSLIIEQIHHNTEPLASNFSTYLADSLHHDYSYLSRLFSTVEGITIEKFIARQRIEKTKELLFYDQLTLETIAYQLGFSSAAYLSAQFKKETGMTPTEFKKQRRPGHRSLDTL